jgi:YhcN/YlaJ family sporulation lipoprotein
MDNKRKQNGGLIKMKLFLVVLLLMVMTGCSGMSDKLQTNAVLPNLTQNLPVSSENPVKHITSETEERQTKIANVAALVDGVKIATAVVAGNTAIVGVVLDEQITDGEFIELRRIIEKAAKDTDVQTEYVSVTNAPDLVSRIYLMQHQEELLQPETE